MQWCREHTDLGVTAHDDELLRAFRDAYGGWISHVQPLLSQLYREGLLTRTRVGNRHLYDIALAAKAEGK